MRHWNEWGKNSVNPPSQNHLSLVARQPWSNTPIPGPITLTTPNDSSISSRISTQLCNKVPTGYNGMLQIHPKKPTFPFDNQQPHLIHLSLNRPHLPPQMTFGSIQLFWHSTFSNWQTQRQTDRWSSRQVSKNILIIHTHLYIALKSTNESRVH